ncbi:MAG: prepilin-type N-terminal cleavage/methylation domain-containing protein [Verrucomicrobiae bacterium]|nr:prepilin-type N-terminal cleavage/methylation domain-containing protein [Verrucomicrobiae bacterium]
MRVGSSKWSRGVTLLELLVAIAVGTLLITVTIVVSDTFIKRAKKARCMANLRTIHSGLLGYLTDQGHWPQMEEDKYDFSEEEFFGFWVKATEPYGLSQANWICPSDSRFIGLPDEAKDKYYGSYVVTRFDNIPSTPFRWNQPWAMERGDFHGKGVHILFPDGSVQDSRNPFAGR